MKLIVLLLIVAGQSFASNWIQDRANACGITWTECRDVAQTCDHYFTCEEDLLAQINSAVSRLLNDVELDKLQLCKELRDMQEFTVEANNTTIDCGDTPNGPQIGG